MGAGKSCNVCHFYPRSPCGERPVLVWCSCGGAFDFYPRSPCGERQLSISRPYWPCYFYPRSPCGERPTSNKPFGRSRLFLSTLSLRRATRSRLHWASPGSYFYPRSPCGERPTPAAVKAAIAISIHALLAESDRHSTKPC